MFASLLLFAEGEAGKQDAPGWTSLVPFLLILPVLYLLMIRPMRKQEQQRQSLISQLKKNDRVVTIGGIYGIVANVQIEADRVTLKIDEATNTKIDVTFSSIARVIAAEPEAKKE